VHISHVYGRTRFSSHAYAGTAVSATLKELLSQAMPPTLMLQYDFLLTILDILQFRSKFYLIFDVCSDSENDSYATIITGVLAQRYAIA